MKNIKSNKVSKKFFSNVLGEVVTFEVERETKIDFNDEVAKFLRITTYVVYAEDTLVATRVYRQVEGEPEKVLSDWGNHNAMLSGIVALAE